MNASDRQSTAAIKICPCYCVNVDRTDQIVLTLFNSKGGCMSADDRHADFEISFIENDRVKITTDACSIVTEYFEDVDAKRTTMSPANIFFSAFAL